jgi:hypothetical protein
MTVSSSASVYSEPPPPLPPRPPEQELSTFYGQLNHNSLRMVSQSIERTELLPKLQPSDLGNSSEAISSQFSQQAASPATVEVDPTSHYLQIETTEPILKEPKENFLAEFTAADDASLALAMSDLFKNEKAKAEEQERLDLEFARKLQEEEDQVGTTPENDQVNEHQSQTFPTPSQPPPTYFPSPQLPLQVHIGVQGESANMKVQSSDPTSSADSSQHNLTRKQSAHSVLDNASARLQSENNHINSTSGMQSRIDPELLRAVCKYFFRL